MSVVGERQYAGVEPRKQLILDAKSVPCTDCGAQYPTYVMDLDHIRGSKKFGLGGSNLTGRSVQEVLDEIAKCDPVCSNCHRERTWGPNKHPHPPKEDDESKVPEGNLRSITMDGQIRRYRGVYPASFGTAWRAYIRHQGKLNYLGTFDTEREAAAAYDRAAAALRGSDAVLNLSDEPDEKGSEVDHPEPAGEAPPDPDADQPLG